MDGFSTQYIRDLKNLLDTFPHDQFEKLIEAMLDCYRKGNRIFVMGNGGSASTASHWICDINKGCCPDKEIKFKMICLNDSISTLMAYANDLSYEEVFVEQLKNFFEPGDVVIGISGSGNSKNVLKAVEYANQNGGITAGLCGYTGGKLYNLVHIPILAKVDDMQKVEDVHMIVAHMAMQRIRCALDVQIELITSWPHIGDLHFVKQNAGPGRAEFSVRPSGASVRAQGVTEAT